MTTNKFDKLENAARGYYYALITGYPLEVHKQRVQLEIDTLRNQGVKQDQIEDALSDIALSIC